MHTKARMLLKGFRDEEAKNEEQVQDFGQIMAKNRAIAAKA
jgi:hypothetical protein